MKRDKVRSKMLTMITVVILLIVSTGQVWAYSRKIRFPHKFLMKTPQGHLFELTSHK